MEKISIILTTFNSEENLPKTLESIFEQDYPEIEVIIKDGKSNDNTMDIIKKYQEKNIKKIRYCSESDKGIYDAMNKGYQMASGEIILFFNDVFSDKYVISKMMKILENNPQSIGAHADLVYVKNGKKIRSWKMGPGLISKGWMPGHPTLFLRKDVYEKCGLYDTTYKCAGDYELIIRVLSGKESALEYLPEVIIEMFYGGTSTRGLAGYLISWKEGVRALKQNGIKNAIYITLLRALKVINQF